MITQTPIQVVLALSKLGNKPTTTHGDAGLALVTQTVRRHMQRLGNLSIAISKASQERDSWST